MSKIRKLMAILLVVLFLATVTIGAISAKPECTKCTKSSSQNNLCIFPIVYLDFRDQCLQQKSQSIISCLVYFVADTNTKLREKNEIRRYYDYFGIITTEYKWTTKKQNLNKY